MTSSMQGSVPVEYAVIVGVIFVAAFATLKLAFDELSSPMEMATDNIKTARNN